MLAIDRLKELLRPQRDVVEIDHLPAEWRRKNLTVEIVELPKFVNGQMLVKVLHREGTFGNVDSKKIWSMTMTPLITKCFVNVIDQYKITDTAKLHGAQLTLRQHGHPPYRTHTDMSVKLKEEPNVS